MTEKFTFSSLIDDVVASARRPNRRADVVSYANNTLRELNVKAYFHADLTEDELTASVSPYIWTKPTWPILLRAIRTVYYPTEDVWPQLIQPGRLQEGKDYYYYGSGPTQYVFKGIGTGNTIDIAYYSFTRNFKYYSSTERPAKFDDETLAWTYLDSGSYVSTLGSTSLDEAAQAKVSNWILERWYELVKEGTLAKLFKVIAEDDRARSSFALYKTGQNDFLKGELHDLDV